MLECYQYLKLILINFYYFDENEGIFHANVIQKMWVFECTLLTLLRVSIVISMLLVKWRIERTHFMSYYNGKMVIQIDLVNSLKTFCSAPNQTFEYIFVSHLFEYDF